LNITISNNRLIMFWAFIYINWFHELIPNFIILYTLRKTQYCDLYHIFNIYIGLHTKNRCWFTLAFPPTSTYLFCNLFGELFFSYYFNYYKCCLYKVFHLKDSLKYLGNTAINRKILDKNLDFKGYLDIELNWSYVALPRSEQDHFEFFKWNF